VDKIGRKVTVKETELKFIRCHSQQMGNFGKLHAQRWVYGEYGMRAALLSVTYRVP